MPRRRPRDGRTGRRNVLAALATGVAGIGLGLNVLQPSAYTSAVAGRGANADVADDTNAVLGMEGLSDSEKDTVFTNNSSEKMEIELDAAPYEDESQIKWDVDDPVTDSDNDSNPLTFSLAAGSSATGNVKGDDKVTFDAIAERISGGTVVGRIEATRTIDVPVINNLDLSGNVSSSGNSGKFEFTLKNTGDVDVELRKIGIIETTTDADYVSGNGSLKNVDSGNTIVTSQISIDNSTSDSTLETISPRPVLDYQTDGDGTPNEITFEFKKFERSGNGQPNVDMRGEDVKIELEVENLKDGSVVTAPVNLCSGNCNF